MSSPRFPSLGWMVVMVMTTPHVITSSCPAPGTSLSLTGSWVVQPVVSLWADFFDCPGVSIAVEQSSNAEGIARACGRVANPTDIGVATRPVRDDEATKIPTESEKDISQCVGSDRQIVAIDVALDGLVILAALGGTASNCLRSLESVTVDQVRCVFSNWTETELMETGDDNSPDGREPFYTPVVRTILFLPLRSYSIAGSLPDTREHQYMQTSTAFSSPEEDFRDSYTAFPETADLIRYMDRTETAVGSLRFAVYDSSRFLLDAVPVVDLRTSAAVRPTAATIAGNEYQPYSRRTYMYVWSEVLADEVLPFVEFGFSEFGTSLVDQVNLVPLSSSEREDIIELLQQPLLVPSGSGTWNRWGIIFSMISLCLLNTQS